VYSHGPALCPSLSDSRALSARAAAKAAASILYLLSRQSQSESERRPCPPVARSAAFEVVNVLTAASASARCCLLARRSPCRRFRGGRATTPKCDVVADVELVTDWGGVWRGAGRRDLG
jgi:hypothetical protein